MEWRFWRASGEIRRAAKPALLAVAAASAVWVAGCSSANRTRIMDAVLLRSPYQTELLKAEQWQREGKIAEAAELYAETLPRMPEAAGQERSAALVHFGDCLAAMGRLREAFAVYQKALEADGDDLDAHLRMAEFLSSGGANVQAAEHAKVVLKRHPNDAMALGILGGAEQASGHTARAKALFQKSLEMDPRRPMVAVALAEIYAGEKDVSAARKVLHDAAEAASDRRQSAIALLALGRLEEQEGDGPGAEAAYRAAVKSDDAVLTNFRLAQYLQRSAQIAEAERVLKHVDEMRPSEPSTLLDFNLNAGRTDAAADQGATSGKMAARMIEAGTERGVVSGSARPAEMLHKYRSLLDETALQVMETEIALAQGDLNKADAQAKLAVRRGEQAAPAHYIYGVVLKRQDKVAEAKAEWNTALEMESDYVPAELALARQNLDEGDLATAEKHVSAVVRDEPANLDALCLFARVLLAEGRTESAVSITRRALAVNPESLEARTVLGEIALRAGKFGAAFIEFEKVLLQDPESAEAMNGILAVYEHGQVTRAVLQKMERVAEAPPSSVSLLEISGRLYAAKGMYKDAERALRKTLELDPKRESAAVALAEARYASGDRDPERFLKVLRKAAGDRATYPALEMLEAAEAERSGDSARAIAGYELAMKSGETSGISANNLAWAYAQQGTKLERALELAKSAVDRDPKNPAALDTLGYVQLKQHSYSEAVGSLNKALALMSGEEWQRQSADVYRRLAEACEGAGMPERASEARSRAESIERRYKR